MNKDLDSLTRTYSRLSRDIGGRIEFACDLDSSEALEVAEQEKTYLDQAFFVLAFSALEKRVTSLASARQATADQRTAMRDAAFDRRLESAVKVAREVLRDEPQWALAGQLSEIRSWYVVRNEIAHGDSPTRLFDVPPVIYRANAIALTFDQVVGAIRRETGDN